MHEAHDMGLAPTSRGMHWCPGGTRSGVLNEDQREETYARKGTLERLCTKQTARGLGD